MPPFLARPTKRTSQRSPAVAELERWKLEDAKARFSELVRLASTNGPQLVTIHGKDAVVVLAPDEYERLLPRPKGHQPLARFLQRLGLDEIDIERDKDTGREMAL